MKTTYLIIIAIAIIASLTISAQEREAPQLDLGDLGWSTTAFDSVTAFDARPFVWGWNWLSTDSNMSHTLGMNVSHRHDPYSWWPNSSNWEFGASRTPGQLLISTVNNISTSTTAPNAYSVPTEAIAMEWQPWLEEQADTFTLRPDDSTGGVWGFYGR